MFNKRNLIIVDDQRELNNSNVNALRNGFAQQDKFTILLFLFLRFRTDGFDDIFANSIKINCSEIYKYINKNQFSQILTELKTIGLKYGYSHEDFKNEMIKMFKDKLEERGNKIYNSIFEELEQIFTTLVFKSMIYYLNYHNSRKLDYEDLYKNLNNNSKKELYFIHNGR